MLRKIAGDYVIIRLTGNAELLPVNETAGEICRLLCKGAGEAEILRELEAQYDAPPDLLYADLRDTLEKLFSFGVLTKEATAQSPHIMSNPEKKGM